MISGAAFVGGLLLFVVGLGLLALFACRWLLPSPGSPSRLAAAGLAGIRWGDKLTAPQVSALVSGALSDRAPGSVPSPSARLVRSPRAVVRGRPVSPFSVNR